MKKRKRHYLYKRRRAQYGEEAHNIRREGGRVATKETGPLRSFGGHRKTIVRLEFTTLGAPSPRVPLESTWSARPPWNGWVGVRLRKLPLRAARKPPLRRTSTEPLSSWVQAGRSWVIHEGLCLSHTHPRITSVTSVDHLGRRQVPPPLIL